MGSPVSCHLFVGYDLRKLVARCGLESRFKELELRYNLTSSGVERHRILGDFKLKLLDVVDRDLALEVSYLSPVKWYSQYLLLCTTVIRVDLSKPVTREMLYRRKPLNSVVRYLIGRNLPLALISIPGTDVKIHFNDGLL